MSGGQISIDFDYDERTSRLSAEIAIILTPHVLPGTPRETIRNLADRLATLAEKRYKDAWEPACDMRCHTCDEMTMPKTRVRVVVCPRCSMQASTPGSSG